RHREMLPQRAPAVDTWGCSAPVRARARRATDTMISSHYFAILDLLGIDVPKKKRAAIFPLHFKLLIEITIANFPSPADANGVATHQTINRGWIKILDQQLHVLLQFVVVSQIGGKTRDRQIGDGVKVVEDDAEMLAQFVFVIGFELGLGRRQKRTDWIVDQVQRQIGAVSKRVQQMQR